MKPGRTGAARWLLPTLRALAVLLLVASNVFMTFAWYGHLKNLSAAPWYVAALVSWGIALAEYLLQVPANRIGHQVYSAAQLKTMQEIITLLVFLPLDQFVQRIDDFLFFFLNALAGPSQFQPSFDVGHLAGDFVQ